MSVRQERPSVGQGREAFGVRRIPALCETAAARKTKAPEYGALQTLRDQGEFPTVRQVLECGQCWRFYLANCVVPAAARWGQTRPTFVGKLGDRGRGRKAFDSEDENKDHFSKDAKTRDKSAL